MEAFDWGSFKSGFELAACGRTDGKGNGVSQDHSMGAVLAAQAAIQRREIFNAVVFHSRDRVEPGCFSPRRPLVVKE